MTDKEEQNTTPETAAPASEEGQNVDGSSEATTSRGAHAAADQKGDAEQAVTDTEQQAAAAETGNTDAGNTEAGTDAEAVGDAAADVEAAESSSADEGGTPLPAHFEPIPEEKLKRAKRTRRILWVIIILLILVLLGAGAGAAYYYLTHEEPTAELDSTKPEIESTSEVQDRGTTETTEMPNLVQMFGKTPEEVVNTLGEDYTITKTDTVGGSETSGTDASGTEPTEEGGEDAEGEAAEPAPAETTTAQQMVTISYSPEAQSSSTSTSQVQNIYLTLNSSGQVAEIYFVSSMGILDFPISSFADLVTTKDSFTKTLSSAGVTVPADIAYTAPTEESYTEYVDPQASVLLIKKETMSFKGALASELPPTSFEITYTYDYGASGVENTPDKQPSQRMLYIKLS